MYVEVGNDHAIEGYREGDSDEVRYRSVEGQHVTRIVFPEGLGLQEAFGSAVAALGHHIEQDRVPAWIESDSDSLRDLLVEHYGIKRNKRPATWGKSPAPAKKTSSKKKG